MAHAVDMFWSVGRGDGSGTFSVANNWTESAPFSSPPPDANDIAHFGMTSGAVPATYTVTFTNSPTNRRAIVEDDHVTFDLNTHVYTLTDTSVAMVLGTVSGRSGRLTITDGVVSLPFESSLEIGSVAGGSGTLTVGAGGVILGEPEIVVGVSGNGTFNINNNGDVVADQVYLGRTAAVSGIANITGNGSVLIARYLRVGTIPASGALNITAAGRVATAFSEIGSTDGTATGRVTGAGSEWISTEQMIVGTGGTGSLIVSEGGYVETLTGLIGFGGTGTATVDGPNSKGTLLGDLRVGVAGIGTLNITGGALVENLAVNANVEVGTSFGHGIVNVDGPNSRWISAANLRVGINGLQNNVVNITDGGFVQNANAFLGGEATARGTVVVSGAGSRWVAETLHVAGLGKGTLNVLAGGRVDLENILLIGNFTDSEGIVTVDGPDSELVSSPIHSVNIGFAGHGELNITGGGRVSSGNVTIAEGSNGTGLVIVSGADSTWQISGPLDIGPDGLGTLRIQSGAVVNVEQETRLHDGDVLLLEGGTLSTRRIDFEGVTQPFFWSSGTLHLGEINADLTVPDDGILAPGIEAGSTKVVTGDLTLSAGGITEIQIGGLQQSVAHDYVDVFLGDVILAGGNLQLALINGFMPGAADTFTIFDVTGGDISGSFGNVANGQRLATSDGLGSFIVNYGPGSAFFPTSVVLSAFQAIQIPGDYNGDGAVKAADYTVWRDTLASTTNLIADGNNSGHVSNADYNFWKARFGNTAGAGAASSSTTAVPEPAAMFLALATLALGPCLVGRK